MLDKKKTFQQANNKFLITTKCSNPVYNTRCVYVVYACVGGRGCLFFLDLGDSSSH